ncbi:MAG: tripartite tricarboxylate transporter substrate binding protein [Burkholderiales bacterium]
MKSRFVILAFALVANSATAQTYPIKTVRIIVPFPTGGTADILARTAGAELSKALGQPFTIENRAGGGGNIGADVVAKAAPDGYNLLMGTNAIITINPHLFPKMPYDAMKDFVAVALVGSAPNVLAVHPSVPAHNLKELVDYARKNPGKLDYASGGNGSTGHLAAELLKSSAKLFVVHIPYRGGPAAVTDTIGGRTNMVFFTVPAVLPQVRSGKLRAIGITSAQRSAAAPDIPTIAEQGFPGYEASAWFGLLAPAGTPADIVTRINAEIGRAMNTPSMRESLAKQGADVITATPAAFTEFLRTDFDKWGRVVKASGATLD